MTTRLTELVKLAGISLVAAGIMSYTSGCSLKSSTRFTPSQSGQCYVAGENFFYPVIPDKGKSKCVDEKKQKSQLSGILY